MPTENMFDLPSESLSAGEKRSWVKYSDFNEYIADAFVVIEDKRFEQHKGVDWLGTVKAGIFSVLYRSGDARRVNYNPAGYKECHRKR